MKISVFRLQTQETLDEHLLRFNELVSLPPPILLHLAVIFGGPSTIKPLPGSEGLLHIEEIFPGFFQCKRPATLPGDDNLNVSYLTVW